LSARILSWVQEAFLSVLIVLTCALADAPGNLMTRRRGAAHIVAVLVIIIIVLVILIFLSLGII
jgi:hypothetical protein